MGQSFGKLLIITMIEAVTEVNDRITKKTGKSMLK